MSVDDDEKSELDCTLWVGNLDSSVTESVLYELFLQAGPIEKIHIPKGKDGTDKGYCFITFLHDESVPYTINLMEGTSLNGKVLKMQPRPGSKHKKIMDAARENEQRIAAQHQPFHVQHQLPAQGPWYIAPPPPQLAQYPNMLVYPNQILQGYPPGLANVNCMPPTLVQFPPGMAPQFLNFSMPPPSHIPVQQAIPQEHYQYAPRGPRPPGEYRHSRPPRPHMNGYTMHRTPNGNNAQPVASQFPQQSQVLNGSQSSQRFVQSSRGPRPHGGQRFQSQYQQQTHQPGPRNGNNANGNVPRMPYSPRNPNHYTQQQPVFPNAGFTETTATTTGGGTVPYQNDRQVYPSPRPQNFATGNGYQFQ